MIWALYSLFSKQKQAVHSDKKSVNSLHFSFIQQSSKLEGLSLSPEIVLKIMSFLDTQTAAKLLLLNQKWSFDACEAFYNSPRLSTADSFPKLIRMLSLKNTYHPYAWLIRDLTFKGIPADELLLGDLQTCLSLCPNLISLNFQGCTQLSTLLVDSLQRHSPFLHSIRLSSCSISHSFIRNLIRGIPRLHDLDISFTSIGLEMLPVIIRECPELVNLDMTACLPCDDRALVEYEKMEYRQFEDSLKTIKSELKKVNLSQTQVTDMMVGYLVRYSSNLETIILNDCKQVSDDGLLAIGMHCPDLKVLDLSGCEKITDNGLQSLSVHLSDSRKKRTSAQTSLGYNDFNSYTKTQQRGVDCPLEVLILSGCVNLTRRGVQLVAKKCPNLRVIVLDGCLKVTDWYLGSPEEDGDSKLENLAIHDDSDTASYVSEEGSGWNSPGMEKKMKRLSVSRRQILEK